MRNLSRRGCLALPLAAAHAARAAARPPNIVFILTDDLGYTAVRCYGGRHARTPNLDRLAAQGVRFTNAYVTPQCTPTRASLLTGQHTARNRMWHVIPYYGYPYARITEPEYSVNLPRGTPTLAASLRAAGYATGIVGKWHLTTNSDGQYVQLFPEAAPHHGFDYAPHYEPKIHQTGDKGVNRFTDEALGFIERNRERPFFLYLAHHTIHGPVVAPEDMVKRYRARGYLMEGIHNAVYLAALEHMDASIGRLLGKLDEWDLAQNTVVVFLSDNGGVDPLFDNAPLRAGKGSAYEGGIRVPAIVRWPGGLPSGAVSDSPVHVVDWYPTLLAMAGARAPAGHTLDGDNLLPHWQGKSAPPRDTHFWYMPLYDPQWGAVPAAVVRQGGYKLIEFFGDYIDIEQDYNYTVGGRVELYNLARDIGERDNLAAKEPRRADAMRQALHRWIREMGAAIPGPNPQYDPARALEVRR